VDAIHARIRHDAKDACKPAVRSQKRETSWQKEGGREHITATKRIDTKGKHEREHLLT
jgi:hypothetical protein